MTAMPAGAWLPINDDTPVDTELLVATTTFLPVRARRAAPDQPWMARAYGTDREFALQVPMTHWMHP